MLKRILLIALLLSLGSCNNPEKVNEDFGPYPTNAEANKDR